MAMTLLFLPPITVVVILFLCFFFMFSSSDGGNAAAAASSSSDGVASCSCSSKTVWWSELVGDRVFRVGIVGGTAHSPCSPVKIQVRLVEDWEG